MKYLLLLLFVAPAMGEVLDSTATLKDTDEYVWKVTTLNSWTSISYFNEDLFYHLKKTTETVMIDKGPYSYDTYTKFLKVYKGIEWTECIRYRPLTDYDGHVKLFGKCEVELVGFSDGTVAWRKK